MTNLCLLISLVPGAYLSTGTRRQWEKWQNRSNQECCKADHHFREATYQAEMILRYQALGEYWGFQDRPFNIFAAPYFSLLTESNFRRVIGTMKGGKRKAKPKRSLSTYPSACAGGWSGRFWFSRVSSVCQRGMYFICTWSQDPSAEYAYKEGSLERKISRAGESSSSLVLVHRICFCKLLPMGWHLSQFQWEEGKITNKEAHSICATNR